METTKKLASLGSLLACLVGPSVSIADNCSGEDVLVAQSAETIEVAKGHSLTVVRLFSVVTSGDTPIFDATTGECSGTWLTTPDGKTRGAGHCARRDKDGDTYSIEWSMAPGADKGQWRVAGGTGKFANKANSGWFQQAVADGKMSVTKWGGNCK